MRQLSRIESLLFLIGGALMVFGVALNFFGMSRVAPWLFAVGAVLFAVMQIRQTYDGTSLAIRRLRSIMTIADVLFIIAGLMLVENNYAFTLPIFGNFGIGGIAFYYQYVAHNNWVIVLFIAAILELYTIHRISSELNKEAKKS